MRVTSLGLATDVALRVLEGAEVSDRGGYLVVRSPDNPDFWWGNFLILPGPPEPGSASAWLARFAAEFPTAQHVALAVDAAYPDATGSGGAGSGGPGHAVPVPAAISVPADFPAAGLEPERGIVLTAASVTPPPRPAEHAGIRPLESDADWQASFDLAVRCFGAEGSQEYLVRRNAARRRLIRAGRGVWFGAFGGGRLLAQLGVCDAGEGRVRYQDVETDPGARRRGLAGTLVWHAGLYARRVLGAATLVIVADPAGEAIRVYRSCGFADAETVLTFERPPAE
ncbi:MAG: GNAT family N-acetyltransferase [Streptosporangiaceae bacterium]